MPVFGRFDGSDCVRLFEDGKFSTRRSLGDTASIRFRLIIIDSSDDLPDFNPALVVTSKLISKLG